MIGLTLSMRTLSKAKLASEGWHDYFQRSGNGISHYNFLSGGEIILSENYRNGTDKITNNQKTCEWQWSIEKEKCSSTAKATTTSGKVKSDAELYSFHHTHWTYLQQKNFTSSCTSTTKYLRNHPITTKVMTQVPPEDSRNSETRELAAMKWKKNRIMSLFPLLLSL